VPLSSHGRPDECWIVWLLALVLPCVPGVPQVRSRNTILAILLDRGIGSVIFDHGRRRRFRSPRVPSTWLVWLV
jgi:hypothetical protein